MSWHSLSPLLCAVALLPGICSHRVQVRHAVAQELKRKQGNDDLQSMHPIGLGIGGRIGYNRPEPEMNSAGGKVVKALIQGYSEKQFEGYSLRYEGVSGPVELRDNHDYYTVQFEITPTLRWSDNGQESSCSHGTVKMRYSDFKELWAIFKEYAQDDSAEFPEKAGILGRLSHLWDTVRFQGAKVAEEMQEKKDDRRAFFEGFIRDVFQSLGSEDGIITLSGYNFKRNQFLRGFYTRNHIHAEIIDKVYGLYDCL